jgi:hypothetical protein
MPKESSLHGADKLLSGRRSEGINCGIKEEEGPVRYQCLMPQIWVEMLVSTANPQEEAYSQ